MIITKVMVLLLQYGKYLFLLPLGSFPGFKYLKDKELVSSKGCKDKEKVLAGSDDFGGTEVCAKMCSDAVECTAFESNGEKCRLTNCGEEHTEKAVGWSTYLKGK